VKAAERIARGDFLPDLVREQDGWHARWIPKEVDSFVRKAAMTPLSAHAENDTHETLHDAWIMALKSETGLVRWDDAECAAFAEVLREWRGDEEKGAGGQKSITFCFEGEAISCAVPRGRAALRALGEAVKIWGPLRGMDNFNVSLTKSEAEDFLVRGAKALRAAGYGVEGDDLAAEITTEVEVKGGGGQRNLQLPLSTSTSNLNLKLTVHVAGEKVTAKEIQFLLDQNSSLVFFRNRWIEVDRNILKEALRALEKSGQCRLTRMQALAFACGIGRIGHLEIEKVAARGWLRGLLGRLKGEGKKAPYSLLPTPYSLRSYQQRGVAWMSFLTQNGFGALLADDMGLGKTVQVIAWMLGKKGTTLIVAPLTLLANWRHELARFAPSLRVYVHQGERHKLTRGFQSEAKRVDVVLTSYNLLVKDHRLFGEVAWRAMVLDEAQSIKNPDTAVARAVRALTPPERIALTGTPIENSVADIWSIEEFLNPGFLGPRKEFSDRFVKPLKLDPHAAAGARLKHALEPFVLRRLKTDPGVAAELGPKHLIREYCSLTTRGRTDYEMALEDYRASKRQRGDVFALLTRLKLICDGAGKFEHLKELLARIFENGEKVLIFTQYAKVGRELKTRLEAAFTREFPFLHGALTARQREKEIAKFRAAKEPTAFILSLRAGGFGLNLTEATHVIHYDRWWNPAVENQATDRAHRIGQAKTVFVHLLMTAGTVEEHVDDILARKTAISGGLVASGEQFLAQLPSDIFEKAVALDE